MLTQNLSLYASGANWMECWRKTDGGIVHWITQESTMSEFFYLLFKHYASIVRLIFCDVRVYSYQGTLLNLNAIISKRPRQDNVNILC
mmetsp:Transcript_5857/g.6749  ORF Transcript_5857/g.6749 Transcript_5857/m.6749 type:complete len:88 (+) Transcript_5857:412-675(+)